jgi:hypothetical protein
MDLPLLMAVEFSKEWAETNIDIFTRIMYTTRLAKIMHITVESLRVQAVRIAGIIGMVISTHRRQWFFYIVKKWANARITHIFLI